MKEAGLNGGQLTAVERKAGGLQGVRWKISLVGREENNDDHRGCPEVVS